MKFIDPRVYAEQNRLHEFTIALRKEFAPIAYEMYDKFISKIGCPRCIFDVADFGFMGSDGKSLMNGFFLPPNYIQISLVNIAISAYDNAVRLNRTDYDKLITCEMAHDILHEISHSTQFTYVEPHMIPAMEYANDRRVFSELVPQLELILKRNYHVDIYRDRIDIYAGKVFSFPYQYVDPAHRLTNFICMNMDVGETPEQTTNLLSMVESINSLYVEITVYGNQVISGYIKYNGQFNQQMGIEFIDKFPRITPMVSIDMHIKCDENNARISLMIDYPEDGNMPIVDMYQ